MLCTWVSYMMLFIWVLYVYDSMYLGYCMYMLLCIWVLYVYVAMYSNMMVCIWGIVYDDDEGEGEEGEGKRCVMK